MFSGIYMLQRFVVFWCSSEKDLIVDIVVFSPVTYISVLCCTQRREIVIDLKM